MTLQNADLIAAIVQKKEHIQMKGENMGYLYLFSVVLLRGRSELWPIWGDLVRCGQDMGAGA